MTMNWQKYLYTQPRKSGWYLVWTDVPGHYDHVGYVDIVYWDGTNWTFNVDTPISWWFEIEPPPSNDKQEKQ